MVLNNDPINNSAVSVLCHLIYFSPVNKWTDLDSLYLEKELRRLNKGILWPLLRVETTLMRESEKSLLALSETTADYDTLWDHSSCSIDRSENPSTLLMLCWQSRVKETCTGYSLILQPAPYNLHPVNWRLLVLSTLNNEYVDVGCVVLAHEMYVISAYLGVARACFWSTFELRYSKDAMFRRTGKGLLCIMKSYLSISFDTCLLTYLLAISALDVHEHRGVDRVSPLRCSISQPLKIFTCRLTP